MPARSTAARLALAAVAGVAGVSLVPATASPAAAHDGAGAAFIGEAGPYTVYAYDGAPATTPGELAYSLILRRTSDGAPVDGATVTADTDGRDGAPGGGPDGVAAAGVANVYELVLPDPSPGAWTVDLVVEADEGAAGTELVLHGSGGVPTPSGGSTLLVAGAAAGTTLVAAGLLGARRRRRVPA